MFFGVQIPPQGVWKPRVTNLRKYNWWMAHGSVTSTIIFVLQDWVILIQDDVMFRLGQMWWVIPRLIQVFGQHIGLGKFHGKMGDLALYFIVHWDVWRLAKQAAIWLERPRLLWPLTRARFASIELRMMWERDEGVMQPVCESVLRNAVPSSFFVWCRAVVWQCVAGWSLPVSPTIIWCCSNYATPVVFVSEDESSRLMQLVFGLIRNQQSARSMHQVLQCLWFGLAWFFVFSSNEETLTCREKAHVLETKHGLNISHSCRGC